MRKTIAAATVAASIAVGGVAGVALGAPVVAGAAETAGGAVGWVQDALSGLVDDGTITQEQADAVETALEEARPERPFGHHGFGGPRVAISAVADALGLSPEELRTELEGGKTIADVAVDEGVDVQEVVDAIVAALETHLDEEVAAGDLTQEQADRFLAGATERATALVNGELRLHGPHHHGPRPDMPAADDTAATDTAA